MRADVVQTMSDEWIVLSTHEGDQAFCDTRKGESMTWELSEDEVKGQACKAFRIQMVGVNSEGNHELHMSGFEVYGDLIDDYEILTNHVLVPNSPRESQ